MEIQDINALGKPKKNKSYEKTKNNTKANVENIISNINFDIIYDGFDYKNPLDNQNITEKYLKGNKGNIFDNYIDFCNYLLDKINNSKNKNEIIKIPLIISNLSNYKGSSRNNKNRIIIEKRNQIMLTYKNKLKTNY